MNIIDSEALTPQMVKEATTFIKTKVNFAIKTGMVLGSGLGQLADKIKDPQYISFDEIPNFPKSTVQGHHGRFVFGYMNEMPVAIMQGRLHIYEGYHPSKTAMGIRIFHALGIENLILTNAAGGVNPVFEAGDIMLIEDHVNYLGTNPLIGKHYDEWGPRFVDMSEPYSELFKEYVKRASHELQINIRQGIYAALMGPSYETKAEIRMLQTLHIDAAGMSTVPEVIVANQLGIKVLALSLITNMGAGILNENISHDDVMKIAMKTGPKFESLIVNVLDKICQTYDE